MSEKNRKQYFKDYFDKNKEKLNEEFICNICGGKYKFIHKSNHIKTKKHQNTLLKNENEALKNIIFDIGRKIENI
jgi:hypothetical protein